MKIISMLRIRRSQAKPAQLVALGTVAGLTLGQGGGGGEDKRYVYNSSSAI